MYDETKSVDNEKINTLYKMFKSSSLDGNTFFKKNE